MTPKYIFVSGGVISGVGKGIAAASIAFIMKSYGYRIQMIKLDPYLNVDAGTMNPLEHGETFVLEDGYETDMDIGHYERFTGELFTEKSSLTSGRVFQRVLNHERTMEYQGNCVTFDTHLPLAIVDWVKKAQLAKNADITIVEIGATVGEEGQKLFLEANRIMKIQNPNDVVHVHVSYLPIPKNLGEMKTKPVQLSVKLLNAVGLHPDFIIARSEVPLDDVRRQKLSFHCYVPEDNVISAPDIENIYQVPLNFEKDDLGTNILKKFGLDAERNGIFKDWEEKYERLSSPLRNVKIGIVGKYYKSGDFDLKDSYVSVIEAIRHAAWEQQLNPVIEWFVADEFDDGDEEVLERLKTMDGIVVPQGWGSRGSEGKIKAIQIVRENKIPYLGLCYGMQMAVIEFARNVAGIDDANSEEVNPDAKNHVIHLMETQKQNLEDNNYGGTIRLGAYPCVVAEGSRLEEMYKEYSNDLFAQLPVVDERHRHRYEFNNEYREVLEKSGLVLSGQSPDGELIEAIELPKDKHPFFIATQYHPELKSQLLRPHPLFMGFIKEAAEMI
jgi:CTP synthase